jgi:hypothetical protein
VKKVFVLAGLVAALAIPAAAFSAELHGPHQNMYSCDFGGKFHFVQNQTGGSQVDNYLTAEFSDDQFVTQKQDKVTPGGTYHWWIDAPPGKLITATSDVEDGKLVLSYYECDDKPKK